MTSDQLARNKQIVTDFFAAQTDPSLGGLKGVADDISLWIAGEKSAAPSSIAGRWHGADAMQTLTARLGKVIAKFDAIDIKHLTAEDDRVAVEAEAFISTRDGGTYNNQYHFLFTIRDGKIHEVKEYLDTVLVNEVFGLASDYDGVAPG